MSNNGPAAPVLTKPKAPTKTPSKPAGPSAPVIPTQTGTSSGSGGTLKLPSVAQLVRAGVPEDIAELVHGRTIPIDTYDGEHPTGEELLDAIDGLSTDTFGPIAKRLTNADITKLQNGLHSYLGIPVNGTESEQVDAATLASAHIPTSGAQAGDLSLVPAVPADSAESADASYTATEHAYELKEINAETDYYKNAISGEIDAADTGATESAKYTALANADATLTAWGIDTPEMNNMIAHMAAEGVTNPNEILDNIRQTATYKKAFAGLAEYNAQPGHIHMTETEYRTYSQTILNAAQQYGVPKGFINQDEIGTLLKGNVSASEFQQRVEDVYSAVANADPGTKALLQSQFNVGPGQLLAYFANPDKALPVLQRQVASAEIGDYAKRVGLSGLTLQGEEQLAQQAKLTATQGNNQLGTGVTSIEGSLLAASKDAALLSSNPGAQKLNIDTNELIGSQIPGFEGTSEVGAQTAVERAEQAKAAPFESGGGDVQTDKGVVGAGSART